MHQRSCPKRRTLVLPWLILAVVVGMIMPSKLEAQPQGGAVSFKSGINDFVRVPSSPSLDSNSFTLELWTRRESPVLDQHCVAYRGANGLDMANGLVVTYGYLGLEAWTVFLNGCALTGTTPQPLGCWVHLAIVYDGGELAFYMNGEEEIREFYPQVLNWDSDLYFGVELDCQNACFDSAQAHAGLIDDIRLWSIPRSQAQVQVGISGVLDDPQFLVGRWNFDERSGVVANDSSGNENHAVLGIPADTGAIINPTFIPDRVIVNIEGNVNKGFGDPADVLYVNGSTGGVARSIVVDMSDRVRVTLIPPPHGPTSAPFALFGYFDGVTKPTKQPGGLGWTTFPTPLNSLHDSQRITVVNNLGPNNVYGRPLYDRRPAPSQVVNVTQNTRRPVTVSLQAFILDNTSTHPDRLSISNSIDLHIR